MIDTLKKNSTDLERIAKKMSRAGLCSRREAEKWILDGRVNVNGIILKSPASKVSNQDKIFVDGKLLPEKSQTRVWRYHKPRGYLVTQNDPKGRPTIFEQLPKYLPRTISVGRLDYDSEGLILLTNNGELSRKLELPSNGWLRRYRIRVHGYVNQETLLKLKDGIKISAFKTGPIEAILDSQKGANAWISIGLREGKNREVRRVMDFIGYPVNRLIRVSYGPFQLGTLPRGEISEIKKNVLMDQLSRTD